MITIMGENQTLARLYSRKAVIKTLLASFVTVFGISTPLLWIGGVSLTHALFLGLAVSFQGISGTSLLLLLPGFRHWSYLGQLGFGLVIGAVILTFTYLFLRTWSQETATHLWWAIPAIFLFLVIAFPPPPDTTAQFSWSPVLQLVTTTVLGTVLLADFWFGNPLQFDSFVAYHPDLSYHEAVSQGLALHGPGQTAFLAGFPFDYHWLADAWAGTVSRSLELEPYEGLSRGMYIFALIASLSLAWSIAARVTKNKYAGFWAATFLAVATPIGLGQTYSYSIFRTDISPTHTFSIPMALAIVLFALNYFDQQNTYWNWSLILLPLLGSAVVISRGPMALVTLVGFGIFLFAAFFSKSLNPIKNRIFVFILLLTTGIIPTYVLAIYSSDTSESNRDLSVRFNTEIVNLYGLFPYSGAGDFLAGTIALFGTVSAFLIGMLFLAQSKSKLPRQSLILLSSFFLLIALVGTIFLSQGGRSQVSFLWAGTALILPVFGLAFAESVEFLSKRSRPTIVFGLFASVFFGVASLFLYENTRQLWFAGYIRWVIPIFVLTCLVVLILLQLHSHKRRTTGLISLAAILVVVFGGAALTASTAATISRSKEALNVEVSSATPISISQDHFDAAKWLREKRPLRDGELLATNRLCDEVEMVPPGCVSTSFIASALTGGPLLIEGFSYGIQSMPDWAQDRVENSYIFGKSANAQSAQYLWDQGVRVMWLDKAVELSGDWKSFGKVLYENDSVVLLELDSRPD